MHIIEKNFPRAFFWWLPVIGIFFSCEVPYHPTEKGFISVHDSKVYYEATGYGQPVFFAHAGLQDHFMWGQQVEQFADNGFQVITIDLPGHSASIDGDSVYLIQDYIKACFDSLGIEKAHLVGLSLGGTSVTDFALAYPERVNKMVLAASLAVGYDRKYPVDSVSAQFFPTLSSAIDSGDLNTAAEVFTKYWCDGMRSKEQVDTTVRGHVYRTTLKNLRDRGWKRWARFSEPPGIERLDQLKMPVMIIYGQYDLPIIIKAADVLSQKIPHAVKKEIKNTAHMLNMEAPREFNSAVIEFLKNK